MADDQPASRRRATDLPSNAFAFVLVLCTTGPLAVAADGADANRVLLQAEAAASGRGDAPFAMPESVIGGRLEATALTISPDGALLCVGHANATVSAGAGGLVPAAPDDQSAAPLTLWDLRTGRRLRRLKGHSEGFEITGVAIDPANRLIASCSYATSSDQLKRLPVFMAEQGSGEDTRIWSVETGEELGRFGFGNRVSFTPDGRRLVVFGEKGTAVLDVAEFPARPLRVLFHQPKGSFGSSPPAVFPDGKSFLAGRRGTVDRVDVETGRVLGAFPLANKTATASAFAASPDGTRIFYGDYHGGRIIDAAGGQLLQQFEGDFRSLRATMFSADGNTVMAAKEWKPVMRLHVRDGRVETLVDDSISRYLTFGPGGAWFAAGSVWSGHSRPDRDEAVDLWHAATGRPVVRFHPSGSGRSWLSETASGAYDADAAVAAQLGLFGGGSGPHRDPERVAAVLSALRGVDLDAGSGFRWEVVERRANGVVVRVEAPRELDGVRFDSLAVEILTGGTSGRAIANAAPNPGGRAVAVVAASLQKDVFIPFARSGQPVVILARAADIGGRNVATARAVLTADGRLDDGSSPSPAAQAAARTVASRRLFFLGIGVGRHEISEYDLEQTPKDVTDLAAFLRRNGPRNDAEVFTRLLLNKDATPEKIAAGLAWLKEAARPGDLVVVQFAGHGLRARRGLYFLPHGGDGQDVYGTCVNWSDVAGSLAENKAGLTLVLLDCCHSGSFGELRLANQAELAAKLGEAKHLAVLAAAGSDELAKERRDLENGVFTHAALQGLNGAADGNADGRVTVGELFAHVVRVVPQLSGGTQRPTAPTLPATAAAIVVVRTPAVD